MKKQKNPPASTTGFTVLEVLAVVVGVGILASVALVGAVNVQEKVRVEKLVQDVRELNTSIQLYQVFGGTLDLDTSPVDVINKLKYTAKDPSADQIVGLTGRYVDTRVNPVLMTDSGELNSNAPRAILNNATKQFEIVTDNLTPGDAVKRFSTDPPFAWTWLFNNYYADRDEIRDNVPIKFAKDSTWVWDYEDSTQTPPGSPTSVPLLPGMTPTAAGIPPGMSQLLPPAFSIPGGNYPLGDFDKTLTFTNPNSPLVSEILYSTVLGSWIYYDGTPISVPAGTTVTAFARSLDPVNWVDSAYGEESYTTSPVTLQISVSAPGSVDYVEAGGALMPGSPAGPTPVTATITLDNPSDIPTGFMNNDTWNAYWTYNGTSPLEVGDETIDQQAGGGGPAWLFSGPDFSLNFPPVTVALGLANWPAAGSMSLKVAGVSQNQEKIVNSTLSTDTITKDVIALRPPQVSTGGGQVTITPVVAYGDMPAGARIYYTTDGTDPGDNGSGNPVAGTLYTAPFTVAGHPCIGQTVMARVYGPSSFESWFSVSANTSVAMPAAPLPGTAQAVAAGFENSSLANYAVLGLGDGKLETGGSAQVWGNIAVGPGNESSLDPIHISGEYHVDPTYDSNKDKVYDIVTNNPISPTVVDLSQTQADAYSLSTTSKGLTPTQTFVKIDVNKTITASATDGFNIIKVQEINLSGETLTLSGGADDWFLLTVSSKLVMNNSNITLSGVAASHVLFNIENGASTVEIKGNSKFFGTLLSPNTQVKVTNTAVVQGVIISGKDTQVKDSAIVQSAGNGFQCEGVTGTVGSGTGTQLELAFSAPASVNYFEAGGAAMPGGTPDAPVGPALITLANAGDIDDAYENSGIFKVYWTEDGSDPADSGNMARETGDPFGGGFPGQEIGMDVASWGGLSVRDFQIAAVSFDTDKVLDSAVTGQQVTIDRTNLRPPTVSESAGTVTMDLVTAFGDMPSGARIFYTTNGAFPKDIDGEPDHGFLYTGPFVLNGANSDACGEFNIVARVFPPSGKNNWFRTSSSSSLVVELTAPPTPGTARRFIYNYSTTGLDDYAIVALKKLETKNDAKVFGSVAVGPGATRKLDPLGIGGNYDVDPTSNLDKDNAYNTAGGAPVSPNTVDLSAFTTEVPNLSAEAAALTPTQTFGTIATTTTIESIAVDGVNVIRITELKLNNETRLVLNGGSNDYFILNITNKLEFKDGSISLTGGIPPAHVIVHLLPGVGDVTLEGDGNLSGTLLATNSKVQIKEDVNVDGSVIVANKDLIIEKEATVGGEEGNFSFDCANGTGGAPIEPEVLSVPLFSVFGGEYPGNQYPLSLTLTNPNAVDSSSIQYSVNGGGFSTYGGGAISIAADDTVQAYCATYDPGQWADSATASHTYTAGANTLLNPVISPSADKFDFGPNSIITVTLTNPNPPALGTLRYRVDNGTWKNYTSPFNLNVVNYVSKTALIEAKVVSTDVGWLDSDVATKYLLSSQPIPLDKPLLALTPGITTTPDGSTVTITDPNEPGTSEILFVLVPIPSVLGCDIIHGVAPPPGTWMTYTGPIEVPDSAYPTGFAVIAYSHGLAPGYVDSGTVVAYDTNDMIGLRGGHFDVDTTGRLKYPGVWSSFPGGGSTDKHTHEFDNKHDTVIVDFFDMGGGDHATVAGSVNPGERFKITIVNANLSPMGHLVINEDPSYSAPYVFAYDDIPFANLPIYSIDGIPDTVKLEKLSIIFDEDAIVNAGLLPSNTGDVKGNTPGKAGEWRNGALTMQVIKVNAAGTPIGGTLDASKSNGDHGVGTNSTVLYETTIFWHWPGDSYHDSGNTYVPMDQSTILSGLDDSEEPLCP